MNCALSISKDSPILHRPKIPKKIIFLCSGISRVRNVSTSRGEGSSHNVSYIFSGIVLWVVKELHVALDHESKSIDSKQVEVYLFQYPMHELFVAAGDISGAFSMRNPTGAYNNNSCHKLRKQQFVIFFCSLFPLFKLPMFAWQFPLAREFARLLRSEDMYSGTSWAVVGLSSVALTKIRLLTSQVWFCDLCLLALALRWSLLPLHWSASCKLAAADDRATKEGPGLRLYEGLWGHEAVSWSEIVGCERRIARLASGMIQFPACLCKYYY